MGDYNDYSAVYKCRVGSTTNVLGRPPRFFLGNELAKNGCRYASVYAVTSQDATAIETGAKTCAGFKGTVWSARLWIDIDSGAEAADKVETFLKEQGYDYVRYETGGGRGAHFGVLRDAAPSHTLPAQDKRWVSENVEGADLGLYWHLHLIRLPGTIHERTGLPKKLIRSNPGRALVLPLYEPESDSQSSESAPVASGGRPGTIFGCWSVVEKLAITNPPDRHRHLLTLAKALQADARVQIEAAMWVVSEVNNGFDEPKPREEVQRIVKWAYGL